jgi:hypothetical protein
VAELGAFCQEGLGPGGDGGERGRGNGVGPVLHRRGKAWPRPGG